MKRLLLVLLGLLVLTPAHATSFNCARASTEVEHLICDNPELSKLDDAMAAKFKSALHGGADRAELARGQRQWLAQRNTCPSVACVENAYKMRLAELSGAPKALGRVQSVGGTNQAVTSAAGELQNLAGNQERVRQIMLSHKFLMMPNGSRSQDSFCKSFLEDFSNMKGITFVAPRIESDSYTDKRWGAYKVRCPSVDLFQTYECDGRLAESMEGLSEEERQAQIKSSCDLFRCTQNFKLFELGGAKNHRDDVIAFYCERMRGPLNQRGAAQREESGGYLVASQDGCSSNRWLPTNDSYSYGFHHALETHNGLIGYRGTYYIFNLNEPDVANHVPNAHYFLQLWGPMGPADGVPSAASVCYFSTASGHLQN